AGWWPRRATPSGSLGWRWNGPKGEKTNDARRRFGRDVRSGPRWASSDRQRGARRAWPRSGLFRAGAPLATEAGWSGRERRSSPRDADVGDRHRAALQSLWHRARPEGSLVHGRYARRIAG